MGEGSLWLWPIPLPGISYFSIYGGQYLTNNPKEGFILAHGSNVMVRKACQHVYEEGMPARVSYTGGSWSVWLPAHISTDQGAESSEHWYSVAS